MGLGGKVPAHAPAAEQQSEYVAYMFQNTMILDDAAKIQFSGTRLEGYNSRIAIPTKNVLLPRKTVRHEHRAQIPRGNPDLRKAEKRKLSLHRQNRPDVDDDQREPFRIPEPSP